MPNINYFQSIFNLNEYKCLNFINDKTKRLDRNALKQINKLFTSFTGSDDSQQSDSINFNDVTQFSLNLAKFITYEDLDLLRFNVDFGLGKFYI
jgi:hypothetical protein